MVALRKLAREELVRGLPELGQVERVCEACQAGKQRLTSFPTQVEYHVRERLELVHGDLCRYMWVAAIPSKDHAVAAIKEIQAWVEGESGVKLRALPTDRGGEFTLIEFAEYCAADGVHRQHTAPYSPQ
jgi:hypothetical protein